MTSIVSEITISGTYTNFPKQGSIRIGAEKGNSYQQVGSGLYNLPNYEDFYYVSAKKVEGNTVLTLAAPTQVLRSHSATSSVRLRFNGSYETVDDVIWLQNAAGFPQAGFIVVDSQNENEVEYFRYLSRDGNMLKDITRGMFKNEDGEYVQDRSGMRNRNHNSDFTWHAPVKLVKEIVDNEIIYNEIIYDKELELNEELTMNSSVSEITISGTHTNFPEQGSIRIGAENGNEDFYYVSTKKVSGQHGAYIGRTDTSFAES